MKMKMALAALAGAALLASPAFAADVLPAGTLITASGTPLLGLAHGFADEPGTNVTPLVADDLEYISADYAIAVDFFTDGRVQVWNNTGATSVPGSYSLTFTFDGAALSGFSLLDTSAVTAGLPSATLVDAHTIRLNFSNLATGAEFDSFTAQITAAPVPEPASYALLGAGLALLAFARRRTQA
ncbi:PEP-CTERM sorting domain-containing protein [Pelomonas sp. KK5]|uniref:PEP-CTERM sorting domain-containing protein n=1 Tax=Pelomonas sp. KK5 TaxID=1855730 RepID=UPI00097C40CF|nr:PEP-CTERM sorting domain-containing protein [Pelomonas sp. KK5]